MVIGLSIGLTLIGKYTCKIVNGDVKVIFSRQIIMIGHAVDLVIIAIGLVLYCSDCRRNTYIGLYIYIGL